MKKIFLVVGVRPHFVKISLLLSELEKRFKVILIHSGQHYDNSLFSDFFNEYNLRKPDYIFSSSIKLSNEMIFHISLELCKCINKEKPDAIIVIGDSNTTLSAALAGFISNIKVAHIEAGVRSYDELLVEERNRVMIDRIASIFFTTSERCVENLKNEGIYRNIYNVGDLLYEVIIKFNQIYDSDEILESLTEKNEEYILLTIHRNENSNKLFIREILSLLGKLNFSIIFPMHPHIRKLLEGDIKLAQYFDSSNVKFIDAVNHKKMLALISNSKFVITDSNGIQRESFFLKKPCIILRNAVEVNETLANNCAVIASNINMIRDSIQFYNSNPNLEFVNDEFNGENCSSRISQILYKILEENG